jgi:hypothetical protein
MNWLEVNKNEDVTGDRIFQVTLRDRECGPHVADVVLKAASLEGMAHHGPLVPQMNAQAIVIAHRTSPLGFQWCGDPVIELVQ